MKSGTDPISAQAITPHPTDDPKAHMETMLAARPEKRGRDIIFFTGFVEDGVSAHVEMIPMDTKAESVGFDNYYLKQSVYQKAAKEGGFEAGLVWTPITIPNGFEESLGDRKEGDLHTYVTAPPFAVMVACKEIGGYKN